MASYRSYENDPIKRKARTAWKNMKNRCYNPSAGNYDRYGGRGIKVCEEWHDSFLPFYEWSLLHGIRLDLTIERVDNNGDYCPENCIWATQKKTQANNTRSNRFVEFNGERKTITQWAEEVGITHQGLTDRLRSPFWSLEEALTTPPNKKKQQHPAARKRIVQLSLDGETIEVFESVTKAAATVKSPTSNISRALTHGGTVRGYRWRYADGGEL